MGYGKVMRMSDFSKSFTLSYDEPRRSCTLRFRCFDTPNAVTLHDVEGGREGFWALAIEILMDVYRDCQALHQLWSFTLPQSDIARLNADVRKVDVDLCTAALISGMKRFNGIEPLFDFTIGPLSYLWKHADAVPSRDSVEQAMRHVGADKVKLGAFGGDGGSFREFVERAPGQARTVVEKGDPNVRIDVGGAAKGFAADRIAVHLRAKGIKSADIDLGGNLFMLGAHPHGRPWRVAVRVPEGLDMPKTVLEVEDCSVVTSGGYERFVEIGGRRYQHIVDVRTGWPSESDIASATVVAKSSLAADMLATTACLVGSQGLAALSSRHPDCRFVAITQDGDVLDYGRP